MAGAAVSSTAASIPVVHHQRQLLHDTVPAATGKSDSNGAVDVITPPKVIRQYNSLVNVSLVAALQKVVPHM